MNMTQFSPTLSSAGRTSLRPFKGRLIPGLICLYLLFILPVYFNNNAGSGLSMPQNILAWIVMMLCSLIALINLLRTGRALTGAFMIAAAIGCGLLILPWMWTPSPLWRAHALPRLAGIVGALLFSLAICQVSLTPRLRRLLLSAVVFTALVQATEAMVQAWLPKIGLQMMDFYGTAPYGIFQQRNLLASWLATGGGIALYLALTARTRRRALSWVLTLYPLCTALVLSQSRTGILGMLLSALMVFFADGPRLRQRPLAVLRRIMLLTSLLVWCGGVSLWAMPSGMPADLTHETSNVQRMLMLEGTAAMISQHPLEGSGLGSFEVLFPQVIEDIGLRMASSSVTHPHNELMYVAAEGGVTALVGLLLIAGVWVWPLVYRLRHPNYCGTCPDTGRWLHAHEGLSGGGWLLPLTGLPIVVHMMTEYPLYLSAPHLLLLILLFRTGLPENVLRPVRVPALPRAFALPLTFLVLPYSLAVLGTGFITQLELTTAEEKMNQDLMPVLPEANWRTLTQIERLDRDRHLLRANVPGFLTRSQDTAEFTTWGERWLAVHNDAEVSAAMALIAHYRGDLATEARLRRHAARVFVHDKRFSKEDE